MSDDHNPYAPPAPPEQVPVLHSSSPITDGADEGSVGEYMLSPEDARAALKARRNKYAWVGWTVAVAVAALNVAVAAGSSEHGTRPLLVPGGVALMFLMLRVWVPISVGRAVERLGAEQRRVRISVGDSGVRIVDGLGTETRMKWGGYKGWYEGSDRVFLLLTSGASHVLPRRAWTREGDFEGVRDVVRRQLAPATTVETTRRFGVRALALWVVLILLFVAIWNFFSDVPRSR